MDLQQLQKVFAGKAELFKLVGYSNLNKENDGEKAYKKAKEPIRGVSWKSVNLTEREVNNWIGKGGWIGLKIPAGLIVVDIDEAKEGELARDILTNIGIKHHAIQTVRGWQFIFNLPEDITPNQQNAFFTWGCFAVDYRVGGKGYVVLPTSNTEGRRWVEVAEQLDIMPKWFNPLFSLAKKERAVTLPIENGVQNNTLNSHGYCLKNKFGLTSTDVAEMMRFLGYYACVPAYDSPEVLERTIDSVLKSEGGQNKTPSNGQQMAQKERDSIKSSIPETLDEWEPIVEIDVYEGLPTFPRVFPKWLQDFIDACVEGLQVPIDMPASCALSVLSTANQAKYYVEVPDADDWEEPICLYNIVIASPSERKTPTLKRFDTPIKEYEKQIIELSSVELKQKKHELKAKQKHMEHLENQYAKKPDEKILEEIRALAPELEDVGNPPRVIVTNATPTKIASMMADSEEKLAILTDEGGFLKRIGKYFVDGNEDADIFLQAFNGKSSRIDRQSREGASLDRPQLTIGALIQPGIIDKMPPEFWEKGMQSRLLYSQPVSMVGKRKLKVKKTSDFVKQAYHDNLSWLLWNKGNWECLTLSESANNVFDKFRDRVEHAQLPGGELSDDLEEWGGKLAGNVLRIAGNLHLAQCAENREISYVIDEEIMTAAVTIGEYYIHQAKSVFGRLDDTGSMKDALYLLKRIKEKTDDKKIVACQVIYQAVKSKRGFKRMSELEEKLAILEERNYIRVIKGSNKKVIIYLHPDFIAATDKLVAKIEQKQALDKGVVIEPSVLEVLESTMEQPSTPQVEVQPLEDVMFL
jgi:hypothetical protein